MHVSHQGAGGRYVISWAACADSVRASGPYEDFDTVWSVTLVDKMSTGIRCTTLNVTTNSLDWWQNFEECCRSLKGILVTLLTRELLRQWQASYLLSSDHRVRAASGGKQNTMMTSRTEQRSDWTSILWSTSTTWQTTTFLSERNCPNCIKNLEWTGHSDWICTYCSRDHVSSISTGVTRADWNMTSDYLISDALR